MFINKVKKIGLGIIIFCVVLMISAGLILLPYIEKWTSRTYSFDTATDYVCNELHLDKIFFSDMGPSYCSLTDYNSSPSMFAYYFWGEKDGEEVIVILLEMKGEDPFIIPRPFVKTYDEIVQMVKDYAAEQSFSQEVEPYMIHAALFEDYGLIEEELDIPIFIDFSSSFKAYQKGGEIIVEKLYSPKDD